MTSDSIDLTNSVVNNTLSTSVTLADFNIDSLPNDGEEDLLYYAHITISGTETFDTSGITETIYTVAGTALVRTNIYGGSGNSYTVIAAIYDAYGQSLITLNKALTIPVEIVGDYPESDDEPLSPEDLLYYNEINVTIQANASLGAYTLNIPSAVTALGVTVSADFSTQLITDTNNKTYWLMVEIGSSPG